MSCGRCTACCTVLGVDEPDSFHKPPGERCAHLCNSRRCTIYDDRPSICESYACLWLALDGNRIELRPDNLGVVLHPQYDNTFLAVEVNRGALNP